MIILFFLIQLASVNSKKIKELSSTWYIDEWCGHGLQYLDDSKCAKSFPSDFNRDWQCPIPYKSTPSKDYQIDNQINNVNVDLSSLDEVILDNDVNLCVIVTQRVMNPNTNKIDLYNKYLCAGDRSMSVPFETWSSSKIFAMMNAAGHLRINESCTTNEYGLDSITYGKHGSTPLGDLATIICSYDTTAGYSSNSLSSYFHDIGWRSRINNLVQNWINLNNVTQSLGGNYGEATPSDLSFLFTNNNDKSDQCEADKDPWPVLYSNSISALTAAEMTRRIVQHQNIKDELKFPGVEWMDVQV
eukprot:gene11422-15306_t